MRVQELKEKAKSLQIKGYYKMKKQDLLDAIKEVEEPVEKPVEKPVKEQNNFYAKLIGVGS